METSSLFTRIDELKSQVDSFRPLKPEQEQSILRKFRLDWNYHSNALEGNVISWGETQIFLEYGLTAKGKPFKDYLDIRGHDEAITFLNDIVHRQQPLTEATIRELHKVLLREPYVIDAVSLDGIRTQKTVQIGQYKTLPNHVLTPSGEIHRYATPEETAAKMGDLMKWFREESAAKRMHPVELAAQFHHRFVAIHPFDDGNGRLSRLLMNLIFLEGGFPPVVIKTERKDEYLFALRTADQGNLEPFVQFVAEEVIRSEELYLRGARGESVEELDDIDKKIRLLKQELQHIAEPVEWSFEAKDSIFSNSIFPLLTTFFTKFAAFEGLFSEVYIQTLGIGINEQGGRVALNPHNLRGDVIKTRETIERYVIDEALIESLSLNFHWNHLKKLPLQSFAHTEILQFKFERLRYSIALQNISPRYFTYGFPLTHEDIAYFVNLACERCLDAIQKVVQAHQTK